MTEEVVTRLHDAIVDSLRRRGTPEGPIRVADLYQEIVPYRAVRATLDVELNADYEHALLRLLAGERGLLRVEPRAAREALREEVDASYPDVGRFRSFADSEVWITLPDPAAEPMTVIDSEDAEEPPASDPDPALAVIDGAETSKIGGDRCPFCERQLPAGREVRFCPKCGGDQRMRPCSECGELLEEDWRYCIRCGRET